MNGAALQSLIYAGYARAAAKTGQPYELYRPSSPISPLEAGNKLGTIDCLFAAEKRFEVPNKFKIPTRYLYADGSRLQQRDLLVGPYGTFFVGDMQPNLPIQALLCNDVLNIDRPEYEGTVLVPQPIAFGMPCFRQLKRVDQRPVPGAYGATTASTPIGEWFVYLPVLWTEIRQGDIVTDETARTYTVSTIDPTEIGTVLVIRQSDTETT